MHQKVFKQQDPELAADSAKCRIWMKISQKVGVFPSKVVYLADVMLNLFCQTHSLNQ